MKEKLPDKWVVEKNEEFTKILDDQEKYKIKVKHFEGDEKITITTYLIEDYTLPIYSSEIFFNKQKITEDKLWQKTIDLIENFENQVL